MKTLLIAVVLLVSSFAIPILARAQEAGPYTCANWNADSTNGRTNIALGWLLATDMLSNGEEFWPRGHRVGSAALEVSVICKRPGNRDQHVSAVFLAVVKDKNHER